MYYDKDKYKRTAAADRAHLKATLERGLELIQRLRDEAYTKGIEWELTSLEKFYTENLYALQEQK